MKKFPKMTANEVIQKQEHYRKITIQAVLRMLGEDMSTKEISERVGISMAEVSAIKTGFSRRQQIIGIRQF